MQVSVEVLSGLKRRLTISVPAQEFERQVSDKLVSAKGRVRLPGFRPGKVPLKEVRRRYGRAIRVDAAEALMRSCYGKSVEQESLWPAGAPHLEVLNMDAGADFEFTASFEVMPEVELADFSAFKVLRPEAEITEADLDNMLLTLRRQNGTWRPTERPAQAGDLVEVEYDSRQQEEGTPFDSGESMSFVIGQNSLPAAFDEALSGMAVGERKVFNATFPADYPDRRLQGRTLSFDLALRGVSLFELPELDDAFFGILGVEEGGLAAFREEVRANMRRELDAKIRSQVKRQVLQALHERHEVPLPKALVDQEMQASRSRFVARLNLPEAQAVKLPEEMFRESAERAVALQLVSRQIVRQYQLEADQASVRAQVERTAEVYTEPAMVARSIYQDETRLAVIESMVIEEKVVDAVLGQAQVESLQATYEDIVADRAVPMPEAAPAAADGSEEARRTE